MTSDDRSESIVLARRVAHLAHERRGTEVVVMDVRTLVDYADAFIIVSGQSARQNLAIAEHIVRELKAQKTYAISKSGLDTGTWICLDLGDIVVHVFDPDTRARYDLELLWADAPRVDVEPEPAVTEGVGAPAVTDTPASETTVAAESPSTSVVDEDGGEAKTKPKRRRAVRRAAVEEADAENAPDSERPADGEPEAGAQDEAPADEAPMPRKQKKAPARQPIPRPVDESDDSEWVPIKKVAKAAKPTKAAPAKAPPARIPTKAAPSKPVPAKSTPAKAGSAKAVTPKAEPIKAPVAKPPKPVRITKASAEAFNRKLAAKKKPKK